MFKRNKRNRIFKEKFKGEKKIWKEISHHKNEKMKPNDKRPILWKKHRYKS